MLVAIALIDGEVTPEAFTNKTPAVRNCLREATDATGTTYTAHGKLTAADIGRGPTDAELESKFHNLNAKTLPQSKRDELIDALWHVDEGNDIGRLVDRLAL